MKDKQNTLQTALTSAEELLQTLLTGLSSNNTGQTGGGYMGQIADAKSRAAHAGAEQEQFKVQIQMKEKELKELEARWKAVEREASDGARNLEAMSAAAEGFKKRLSETGWSEEKEQTYESALREAKQEVRRLTEVRRLLSVCWRLMTDPTSPDSGWRQVQGSPP